ncbi:MAG TPA: ATP-dependent helicase [Spirochaetota bacterium]|mgnify:CR=1 FL=1|nr:ATP-dependent helicase [Spirochaetota bacterium]
MKKSFLGIPLDCVTSIMSLDEKHRTQILTEIPEELVAPFTELREKFDMIKRDRNLIDYDDMISSASDIIDTSDKVRHAVRNRFRFIFVDEYQDISEDLFRFVTRISGTDGNICAAGDDAQSIYGFRSADIGYIVRFRKYFPNATIHMLSRNYRSKKEIVDLASLCISRNRFRIRKKIISAAGKGGSICTHPYKSDHDQYRLALEIIREEKLNGSSIAVLFRNNYQGELLRTFIRNSEKNYDLSTIEFITIHGAKGLEYDTVIILGIEDGIFPSDLSDIEEERRLFYVAITRAIKSLHLLYYSNAKETARFARETFLSAGWTARRCFTGTRSVVAGIKTSSKKLFIRDHNRS